MDTPVSLFSMTLFDNNPPQSGNVIVDGGIVGVYRFYHACGSLACLTAHRNPKSNRYHCEKCGRVKKAEVVLRKES